MSKDYEQGFNDAVGLLNSILQGQVYASPHAWRPYLPYAAKPGDLEDSDSWRVRRLSPFGKWDWLAEILPHASTPFFRSFPTERQARQAIEDALIPGAVVVTRESVNDQK